MFRIKTEHISETGAWNSFCKWAMRISMEIAYCLFQNPEVFLDTNSIDGLNNSGCDYITSLIWPDYDNDKVRMVYVMQERHNSIVHICVTNEVLILKNHRGKWHTHTRKICWALIFLIIRVASLMVIGSLSRPDFIFPSCFLKFFIRINPFPVSLDSK